MCAKHGANLRGESPLRALMVGIASQEQGRRREAGFEGSWRQKSDSTNRNRIRGRGGGVSQHWMARPGGKNRILPWETCLAVRRNGTSVMET